MKVPYKVYPDSAGDFVYAAVLDVQIAAPGKYAPRTKRFEAIIDSGASRCLFHAQIGKAAGLDIRGGVTEQTVGITGEASTVYLHDVSLYVPGGVLAIRAGFTDSLPVGGLLGMKGFFEYFRITFDPIGHGFELERIHQT